MAKNSNFMRSKLKHFILFTVKLVSIAFFIAALSTLGIWLSNKSAQPILNNLSFTWLNLVIWLASLVLAACLVQRFVRNEHIFSKDFKKSVASEVPVKILLKILRNLLTSLTICLPSLFLIGFFIISNTYFRYSILTSGQTWLNGYGWYFVITLLALLIGLLLGMLAVRISGKKSLLNLSASLVLAIIMCVLAYMPAYHQTKQVANAVSGISSTIQSQTIASTSGLNFNFYKPSYVPPSYTINSNDIYGPMINSAYTPDQEPENFEISFFSSNNTSGEIFIYDYAAPPSYNPPTSCGNDARGYDGKAGASCVLIGNSTVGCNVYAISDKVNGNQTFCQLGDTVINAYIYSSLVPGQSVTSKAQYSQIIAMYNSMHKLTTAQAQQLIERAANN
jgi:hypothetical protein